MNEVEYNQRLMWRLQERMGNSVRQAFEFKDWANDDSIYSVVAQVVVGKDSVYPEGAEEKTVKFFVNADSEYLALQSVIHYLAEGTKISPEIKGLAVSKAINTITL